MLRLYCDERGADVNALARNEHIQTAAIHAAAASGDTGSDESTRYELVKLVLEHGADPNLGKVAASARSTRRGRTGTQRVEALLLEHGASD